MTQAPKDLTPDTIVEFLASIFERRGGEEYLGEPVTMGEHMLQGATIAEQNGQPDEIIVGALLHAGAAAAPPPMEEAYESMPAPDKGAAPWGRASR